MHTHDISQVQSAVIAVILLGGVISRTSYGCLMFVASFITILFLVNNVPRFQKYNPIILVSNNMLLLTGDTMPKDLITGFIISIGIIILSTATVIGLFNKK